MPYTVKKYNGTPLVTIADRTVNTTASDIRLPGRNYPSYGEPVIDDLIWMLENFSGVNPPSNPLVGQLWYDAANSIIKVYSGTEWVGTGKTLVGTTAPSVSVSGQFWYDPTRQQVFISDINLPGTWKLVGPIGAANRNDGLPSIPTYTAIDSAVILDNSSGSHYIMRFTVAGNLIAIISNSSQFTPAPPITGFPIINPGINLTTVGSPQLTGGKSDGVAITAVTASNSILFNSLTTATFMRNDQTNIPVNDITNDLGAVAKRYSNVYAVNFNGTATAALYSDLAERYESDTQISSGSVVCLGGEKEVTLSRKKGDTDVFGVVSTNPAIMMNSGAGDDDTHPYVAFSGRVPVRVVGKVTKGQRLMTSDISGIAEAWDESFGILAIIGRALESKSTTDVELIEVVVGTK